VATLTPVQLAFLAAIVAGAFLIEAAAGFGSIVVALTVGALLFPVGQLLGWLLPLNIALSTYLVVRGWKALDRRFLLKNMLPLMAVGLVGGTLLAHGMEAGWLKPVFAVLVLVLATWELAKGLTLQALTPLPAGARTTALLGAGLVHGVFATGGPLAVFVAGRELSGKAAFRATLSALWLILNLLVLPRLVLEGAVTRSSLGVSAFLLVPLAVGIAAGEALHARLDEKRFRLVVAGLLLVAGGILLTTSLTKGGA